MIEKERRATVKLSVIALFLLVATLFSCLGYAQVTDTLRIQGSAKIEVPYGLFITEIIEQGASNVEHESHRFLDYTTTVECLIDKKDDTKTSGWRPTTTKYEGSFTYDIVVYNNTEYEYAYRGLYYQKNEYNNSYVDTNKGDEKIGVVTSFPNGSIVAPGEKLTFKVTYTIGKNMDAKTDWKTLINFQFGINVNSIDAATDIVVAKFLNILNTTSTYNELIEVLDDKFDGNQEWTSNYIGNVGNAVDNDMMTVETLFAGQLTMMVNGKAQKAWVLIKHENLDNNEMTGDDYTLNYNQYGLVTHKGCEMTLYLTVDKLDKANSWAPVYATVFTCDRDEAGNMASQWYKVGDSYYGQANIVGYRGESGGTGSFVTDNWKSHSSTYKVSDDYSYSVGADITIKTLMQTVDQSTIRAFQGLLTDAEAMIANEKYAGTGIKVVEEAYRKAAKFYTMDANGKAIANNDTRRVWLIPIMNELNHVLTVAQDAIDKIEQGR